MSAEPPFDETLAVVTFLLVRPVLAIDLPLDVAWIIQLGLDRRELASRRNILRTYFI